MSFAPINPRSLIDREFRLERIGWSVYDFEEGDTRGVFRVVAIPTNIFEVPAGQIPPNVPRPQLVIVTQGAVGFSNRGPKHEPDPTPLTQNDVLNPQNRDVTGSITPRDEPFNEVVIGGNPTLRVRLRTTISQITMMNNRWNSFGDPVFWVSHATSHSVSEFPAGDLTSR